MDQIPPVAHVRRSPEGDLEWVGIKTLQTISFCAKDNELALQRWNPATGATHVQPLGPLGDVYDVDQLPLGSGTMFLWRQSSCDKDYRVTGSIWRVAWLTPQGITSVAMPTPDEPESLRLIALSDEAVLILQRSPKTRHIGGYLARLQGRQVTLEPMPELQESYRNDFAMVSLDDHRVMILGGSDSQYRACFIDDSCRASTWILDVRGKSWSNGPNMLQPRAEAAAFRLPDGSVMVAGGWTPTDRWGRGPSRTAELWNAKRNVFEPLPSMPVATALAKPQWLPGYEGRILLFAQGTSADLPAFDLATRSWFDAGSWRNGSQNGAYAFFPFKFEGRFYAWQWYKSDGFYGTDDGGARLAMLQLPLDVCPLPASPNAETVATHRNIRGLTFLAPKDQQPALLLGGQVHAGMNDYSFAATVDGVTSSGQVFALPTLRYARGRPSVLRIGQGLLVLGGKVDSGHQRNAPPPPAEWLPSTQEGLHAQWQVLPDLHLDPDAIVGQGRDGRLFVLGQGGAIDQIQVQLRNGVPEFTRGSWLQLDTPRRNPKIKDAQYVELPDGQVILARSGAIRVRELADGQVVVAGGEVQQEKIALLTEQSNRSDAADRYVGYGPYVPARTFETYSPVTHQWTVSPPAPSLGGVPIIRDDGSVILVHDDRWKKQPVSVESFDPKTRHWSSGEAPLPGFLSLADVSWFDTQGNAFLAGPIGNVTDAAGKVQVMRGLQWFDPHTGRWSWFWKGPRPEAWRDDPGLLIIRPAAKGQTLMVPAGGLACEACNLLNPTGEVP